MLVRHFDILVSHPHAGFDTVYISDQSASAAVNRVHRHSGERADQILKGRVRIIK